MSTLRQKAKGIKQAMLILVHGKWLMVMSILVMYTMLILVNIGHVHYVDIGQYWSYNIGQYCQSSILKKTNPTIGVFQVQSRLVNIGNIENFQSRIHRVVHVADGDAAFCHSCQCQPAVVRGG